MHKVHGEIEPPKTKFMSKRNRHRLTDNVQDGQTDSAPPKLNVVVHDPDEDEEGTSFLQKTSAFFAGCWEKIASFSKSAASKTWSWCKPAAQGTWNALKKIPSYCVIRWDAEDEDDTDPLDLDAKTESVKTEPVQAVAPAVSIKPESKAKAAPIKTDYDEDELAPSRWWNLGIKAAAVAAAVLVLAGGYFGIKSFLNAPTDEIADIEILEPIEQSPLLVQETPPVVEQTADGRRQTAAEVAAEAPAVAAPPITAAFESAPPVEQTADGRRQTAADVVEVSPVVARDLPITPQTPTIAESAPLIANDAFGVLPPQIEPLPTAPQLTALQPLPPMQTVPTTPISQPSPLQPLVALHASALPASVGSLPIPVSASVYAPIANQYGQQGGSSNVTFQRTPESPSVTALPPSTVERSIIVAAPVPEIIPQIPHSGTVQHISPPPAQTVANVTESAPSVEQFMKSSESAPAIPKDAPVVESPVVVPAAAPVSDTPPIDRQLWEQVHEIRNRTDEPMQVRLDETATTTEPALRFTPKSAVSSADNPLAQEAMNSFQNLRPAIQLSPADLKDIETALSALEKDAPQPVWAQTAPAYRNDSTQTNREGGLTFQSRIDSAISRSPQETETYIVRQGDTYMTISDRFYGTSLLYNALAQHNRQSGIGWRPAEGVVIEIPTAEYLRMNYGESANRQERRLESQRPAIRYVVQEGDTVFRLATDKLQDSTRWREIYALNTDQLQDVRDLKPGMEILLPIETARQN